MNTRPFPRPRLAVLPAAAACALLLLCCPQAAAQGFADGLALCAYRLLPALFPFFVLSALWMAAPGAARLAAPLRPLARACGLPADEAPAILLLSWLGGYAVCAQLTGDALRCGRLDAPAAQRLLIVGCCSGPGFVVGSVGGLMLGSPRLGALLYGLQLAANLLAAALLSLAGAPVFARRPLPPVPEARAAGGKQAQLSLPGAISAAVDSSLAVCGCVLFFRTIGAAVESLLTPAAPAAALLRGALEISAGCSAFAAMGGRAALYGVCLCLSGLGLSVFAQLRGLAGVPLGTFALSRLLHAVLLVGLTRLCTAALPGQAAVFSSLAPRVVTATRLPPDAACVLFCFLCAVLYKTAKKFYTM